MNSRTRHSALLATLRIAGAWMLAVVCLVAQAQSIEVHLGERWVEQNAPFRLVVEVEGDDVAEPATPEVDGLTISGPHGRSRSTQMSLVGGKVSWRKTLTLNYEAVAHHTGVVTIPPFEAELDGQLVRSQPVRVEVHESRRPAAPPDLTSGAAPSAPPSPRPNSRNRRLGWEDAAYVSVEVDKETAYVGEAIQLTASLWVVEGHGVRVQMGPFPETGGFYAVPEQPRERPARRQVHEGVEYKVSTYEQTLFATQAGELTIGPWEGHAGVVRFFDLESHKRLYSPSITVSIQTLPPGAPPIFSGAVGQFEMSGAIDKQQIIQGVPAAVRVTITGLGNPDAVGAPDFPRVEGLYVAEPDVSTRTLSMSEGAGLEKVFRYAVTPVEAGNFTIPPARFAFFSPDTETYEVAQAGPFELEVLAAAQGRQQLVVSEDVQLEEQAIEVIGEDLHPIITEAGNLDRERSHAASLTIFGVTPPVLAGAFALFMRRRRRFETDLSFARSQRARARLNKRLEALSQQSNPSDGLHKALTGYLADKLGLPEGAMTSDDARHHIETLDVPPETVAGVVKVLRSCERAGYGGAPLRPEEMAALVSATQGYCSAIETAARKERRP